MSISDLLRWATKELTNAGIETARLDAEVLLAYTLDKDRTSLFINSENIVSNEKEIHYRILIKERLLRKPVNYITGYKEFMSLGFKVNKNVLIPRPETELLVETAYKLKKSGNKVLEIGTGSGAIAISLAKFNEDCHIFATDISIDALLVARENAIYHDVADRISFIQCNLFDSLSFNENFNLVISNPPYIPTDDLANLSDDIKIYEPKLALDGGVDGLNIIRHIIENAYKVLTPGGLLMLEIGYGQSESVIKISSETGRYNNYNILEDYSGIPRIFYCEGLING